MTTSCGDHGTKGTENDTNAGGSFHCTFPDGPNSSTVSASATDSDGETGNTATQNVTIANLAPTVIVTGAANVNEGTTHTYNFTVTDAGQDTFSAVAGYPDCDAGATNNGTLVYGSYLPTPTGGSFQCSFPDGPSSANVKLKIQDSDGASDIDSESVQVATVANVAPSVTAAANQTASEGSSTAFDLGSFTDPGPDAPWHVNVDWGDGTTHAMFDASTTGALGTKNHTYADNGSYTVTVKVTDKNNDYDSKTFTVTVSNVTPTVTAPSDTTANEGQSNSFGLGSFSDPGADSPWHVKVNLADGSPEQTLADRTVTGSLGMAGHAYGDNGVYTVTVTVTDKDNASGSKTYNVTVNNVAPTASLGNTDRSTRVGPRRCRSPPRPTSRLTRRPDSTTTSSATAAPSRAPRTTPPPAPAPRRRARSPTTGTRRLNVVCCYAGAVDEGEEVLRPMKTFGSPVLDLCVPKPFLEHQAMFDPAFPHYRWYYNRAPRAAHRRGDRHHCRALAAHPLTAFYRFPGLAARRSGIPGGSRRDRLRHEARGMPSTSPPARDGGWLRLRARVGSGSVVGARALPHERLRELPRGGGGGAGPASLWRGEVRPPQGAGSKCCPTTSSA